MKQPFTSIFGVVGMIAGAWMGYRFAGAWTSAIVGAFVGMVIIFPYATLVFPALLLDERYDKTTSRELVRGWAILVILSSAIFVIFTPKCLCGGYLGYADPFTPLAIFFICLISFVRIAQFKKSPDYSPADDPTVGEKIFLRPLGLLGLLAIFSIFLWHTEPICIGISKIGAGDYKAAISVLDDVIQKDAYNAMAYNNRGIAKSFSGDTDGAIEDFTAVINLEPKNANAYLMRGAILLHKGKKDESQQDFDEFLKLNPNGKSQLDKTIKDVENALEPKHQ